MCIYNGNLIRPATVAAGFAASFLVTAAICELSSYYVINPWWYIAAAVPHSLLGGNCVFSVAALCFISDITDTKSRPYR